MTQAFNELYKELRKEVVKRTVEDIKDSWEDCDIRKDEYELTDAYVRCIRNDIIDAVISEIAYDLEHCFDEDCDDVATEITDELVKDGFIVRE